MAGGGIRGHIGHQPHMPNPHREYSQAEESQFRQHIAFQLQFIASQINNVANAKTKDSISSMMAMNFFLQ